MVRANLEATLGLKLPSPATTTKEDYSADCGICYSYRLKREKPPGSVALSTGTLAGEIAGDRGSRAACVRYPRVLQPVVCLLEALSTPKFAEWKRGGG